MENKIAIEPIENALVFLGSSLQAKYVQRYAMALGAKMVVVETEYVDEDYLLDFQNFYSRSFGPKKCTTGRAHFFSNVTNVQELENNLFDPSSTKKLNDNYI